MTKQEHNRKYYLKHKADILAKHKFYKLEFPKKYPYKPEYWKRWYAKPEKRIKYRAQKKAYALSPRGRASSIERLFRFIDRHPEYDIEFLERMLRIAEKNYSLDMVRGENQVNYYQVLKA